MIIDNDTNKPTIVRMSDATHYLVGTMTENDVFSAITGQRNINSFRIFAEAKDYLRSLEYKEANVRFQSAYDEMCGLSNSQPYLEKVIL